MLFVVNTQGQNSRNNNLKLANEYFQLGDYEKAKDLYSKLAKNKNLVPQIHQNYLQVLYSEENFEEIEKYLNQATKNFPGNYLYTIDQAQFYEKTDRPEKSKQVIAQLISKYQTDQNRIRSLAQTFYNKGLPDYAVLAYESARTHFKNPTIYSIELAHIYRATNQKEDMVREFLNYGESNPQNITYVKNSLQHYLSEPEDLDAMEELLYEKVQAQPDTKIYSELLIWSKIQRKDFYGAFIQARAFDKRYDLPGDKLMEVGIISFENDDFKNASKCFEHIQNNFPNGQQTLEAKRYLIKSREEIVKATYPVDLDQIRQLVSDYQNFLVENGATPATLEALRSKAHLYAFYLDELDSAVTTLQTVIDHPRSTLLLKSNCKLDLGDIYILDGQPWESSLLYSQVEKDMKLEITGYRAKLKNAKLSYFKGDFDLAKSHLDILKLATTREIANDAMDLSLRIQNNSALDTSYHALAAFANTELLLFQNNKQEALVALDSMLSKFDGHTLTDEVYWLKANIFMEIGQFEDAMVNLELIKAGYSEGILADDAYFLMGKIQEEQLGDKAAAQEIYQNFMVAYPGSLFVAEARKRFRTLRGDFVN